VRERLLVPILGIQDLTHLSEPIQTNDYNEK